MTRIRQMAPLLYIINFSKLRFCVRNETTLISAKNRVDMSSISEVSSYITEWPRFLAHPVVSMISDGLLVLTETLFVVVIDMCEK